MQFIGVMAGIAALRAPIEEMGTKYGVPLAELINTIRETFHFSTFPILGPAPINTPLQNFSMLTFQNGEINLGGEDRRGAIHTFNTSPDGIIASCRRTEAADAVIDKYAEVIDGKYGSRFHEITRHRLYSSGVVVRFDKVLADKLNVLNAISAIISNAIDRNTRDLRFAERPFRLKRISFGEEAGEIQTTNLFEALERADFLIEARIQHDLSENVFFCSAPLPTATHIAMLEEIEVVAAAAQN